MALRPNTRLISVMMANNETGVIQQVEEIGRSRKKPMSSFIPMRCQAAGKVPIDVQKIACDALSISGHKIHAPQGTGALYIKKGTLIQPQIYGGSHERQRRAGTENLPGIVGIGKAVEISKQWLEGERPGGDGCDARPLAGCDCELHGRCGREWHGRCAGSEHHEPVVRPH